jgi:hypothetical protein
MFRNWNSKALVCAAALVLAFVSGCKSGISAGEYAKAQLDCQNLMSMHSWYHSAFMNDQEIANIWAQKQPDVVFAQNSGFWKGLDKIKAYYGVAINDKSQVAGHFQMHNITTGVIVVADDGQTAKGIFYTPGMVGSYNQGGWMWERYGADFIKEDGVWKIWHLHVYSDFNAMFSLGGGGGTPGGGAPGGAAPGGGAPGGAAPGGKQAKGGAMAKTEKFGPESLAGGGAQGGPGGGGTCPGGGRQVAPGVCLSAEALTPSYSAKQGYKELGPDTIPLMVPRPPVPYKTFSETFSYADPDEYANALAAVKR